MQMCWRALTAPLPVLLVWVLAGTSGCVYYQKGPPTVHFEEFSTKPPKADTVTVCHAYSCKAQTPFTFSQADIAEIAAEMTRVKREDNPAEERRAIAYAVAWMERRVAPSVGTATDQPGMQFAASGIKSQQDCVDEATNTTSYLLVLQRHGLIKHHDVERPFAKDSLRKWTHWAALIKEKPSGTLFAIDSSASRNGENPTVQVAASFYVPDGPGDNTPPEKGPTIADANDGTMNASFSYSNGAP